MRPPQPRGGLGAAVRAVLVSSPPDGEDHLSLPAAADDAEDAVLALWMLQELHYRGFDGVDDAWEWHPSLTGLRASLERDLEARLRKRFAEAGGFGVHGPDVVTGLQQMIEADDAPSVARHLHHHGTQEQAHDMLRQRSVYHLKEADPTAWVVPRLTARTKAALVEIQFDEYGAGEPNRLHHRIFERGLDACGLSGEYGAYVDEAMPSILEQNATLSMLGLHRRLRGAALGHFAAFEATSSVPSRRLAQAFRRIGLAEEMSVYYDEHVEADAVHEQLALRDVCGTLVEEEPELAEDVLFGAWTCLDLEARTAADLLQRWEVEVA